ncbi:MAG: hypothetical protein GF313_14110 [Caldithrix sp.]|nr:hypothetical protein [Caldithrix sp.]
MKRLKYALTVSFIICLSVNCYSQTSEEKEDQKIKLKKLYLEQKLQRSVMNLAAILTCGIAYAKSQGETPEDYGKFVGDILAASWKGSKGKGISAFVKGMYLNFQSDRNCKWEIVNNSENSVTVKMNRFGDETVKYYAYAGVTPQEYDRTMGKLMEAITDYLGFDYEQELEGDQIVFTVSE